ncbi:TetR/AcrR family transcriptional regulator [Streptomyces sp. NPDC001933]|uniref:TetR/AcrR family transcriptional regulator n=1 Tax=Streptomyces sp. NPDC001933 TaxID=3364626 RepID=UPI0036CBC8FD
MSTESQILLAAERLIATQGVHATSLRQISMEASQRNTAAAQYHFKSKQLLIEAVFDHRRGGIDVRRHQLLTLAQESGRAADPWHLTEVLVLPLAEQAMRPGSHYVRFLQRIFEYAGHDVAALSEIGGLSEAAAVGLLLRERLPSLSGPRAHARFRWAGQLIIAGLADLEQRCTAHDAAHDSVDPDELVLGLIDAVTGLLAAPVSVSLPGRRHGSPGGG